MIKMKKWVAIPVAIASVASIGCSDNETVVPVNSSASSTVASSTSATTSASTGSGGSGGSGGSTSTATTTTGVGGAGGGTTGSGGAGGGAAVTCLDASTYAAYFTLMDSKLCVVGIHDAGVDLGYDAPTWGSQGGPLIANPDNAVASSVDLVRFTVPDDPMGALTNTSTVVPAMLPAMSYLGAQALDLPFFGWTAISYTTTSALVTGKVLFVSSGAVALDYDVNGFYAAASVGAMSSEGRLIYSGLSLLGSVAADTNALYAADSCGSAAVNPRLVPSGDASCAAPIAVSAWDSSSGPVAFDSQGNAFATMSDSGAGTQEMRGFAAASIARGAPAATGDTIIKINGFGTSLAALAPTMSDSGVIAFQPSDSNSFAALDVVEQRFAVANGKIVPTDPIATPTPLLKLTTAATALTLMTDDQGQIWVGAPKMGASSVFVVIARKP